MNPPTTDEQDARDMERLAGGHDPALNELIERHGEKLFQYLIRCLQNEDDAADVAQEAFTRVYQHRTKFRTGSKFSTWLYTIAANLVKTRYRFRARHPAVSLNAESPETRHSLGEVLSEDRPTPSESLQAAERAAAVRRAIAALPEHLRTPLILSEYEERSQAEIGEILGCTAKAVETRIYRARQQLRASLGRLLETA
jgi:RNA polymerase sigma-70 factor (ECF subfamily)